MNTFISHSIFLRPEERKALSKKDAIVETVGVSSLSQGTEQIIKEMFCQYLLTNEPMDKPIEVTPTGYKIYIELRKCENLLDIKEGGSTWLMIKKEIDNTYHQIVIADISILEESTICLHWPQNPSAKPTSSVVQP